jgi:hypothetical protein
MIRRFFSPSTGMSATTEPRILHCTLSGALAPFSSGIFGRSEIIGLNGSSDAWFAAGLLARSRCDEKLLVVASDQAGASAFIGP